MEGGIVSARITMGAAQGILEYNGKEDVAKLVNRHWAYSLLKGMKFVWHKATTAKSKFSPSNLADLEKSFFAVCSSDSYHGRNFTTAHIIVSLSC